MNHLPVELVNIILEFQGYHVFRNGKFMKRISKTDERYAVLTSKPKIQTNNSWFASNQYIATFRKTINDIVYDFDIGVFLLDDTEIRWVMYVKEQCQEIQMNLITTDWKLCRSKCVSFSLPHA